MSARLYRTQLLDVDLKIIHHLIKYLLDSETQSAPLAGKLTCCSKNWTKLSHDPNTMSMVQGYNIYSSEVPFQEVFPVAPRVNQEERFLIESEVQGMLKKGAIHQVLTK